MIHVEAHVVCDYLGDDEAGEDSCEADFTMDWFDLPLDLASAVLRQAEQRGWVVASQGQRRHILLCPLHEPPGPR